MSDLKWPLVSVIVCTYNQEQWIRQTLDGILGQKTEYSYEIVIGEDCGRDGTRSVCEQYAQKYDNVHLLPQDHNLGLVANWVNCVKHSRGKYLMCCAGDDYWHNPNKIQMQVDYMENHPGCVACHTDFDQLNIHTGNLIASYNKHNNVIVPQGSIQREVLSGDAHVAAVTLCLRKSCVDDKVPLQKYVELDFPREDWPTLVILSAYGSVSYLPESTSTYRVGQESATRSSDYNVIRQRLRRDKTMAEFLYSMFPGLGTFTDGPWFDNVAWHQMMMAAYRNNDYKSAHKFAKRDVYPTIATYMAYSFLSFKLYRSFFMK